MLLRNRLWNRLVEIDRAIRKRQNDLLSNESEDQEFNGLQKILKQLRAEVKSRRRFERTSSPSVSALLNQVKTVKGQVHSAVLNAKEARKERRERNRDSLKEIEINRKALIKETRSGSQLYWGNYDEVLQDFEISRTRAIKHGAGLHFRHWDGSGKVTVRFQNGLGVQEAFAKNRRLQIDPVPEDAWASERRSIRRRLARTLVRIRVGSKPNGTPVWFELPIVLHRPMPNNGLIRSASVIREKLGLSWRYRLIVTVRDGDLAQPRTGGLAVGIDLHYRVTPEGLRVGYWHAEDSGHGALTIPNSDVQQFLKIDELESTLTSAYRQVKDSLVSLMESHGAPESLLRLAYDATQSLSPESLLRLIAEWETFKFPTDNAIYGGLLHWRRKYIHLWTWQAHLRDQLIRRRRELYRCFAAQLTQRFGRVFLRGVDLAEASKPQALESANRFGERQCRTIGAVSVLANVINSACGRAGIPVIRIEVNDAPTTCQSCGWVGEFGNLQRCPHCGESWDPDHNSAAYILRRGQVLDVRESLLDGHANSRRSRPLVKSGRGTQTPKS